MTLLPPKWSVAELTEQSVISTSRFRSDRLASSVEWSQHVKDAREKFDALFDELSSLAPGGISDKSLACAYGKKLGEALRYLAGPPVSDDDLKVLAEVQSIAPSILMKNLVIMRKVFSVIERIIDPHRFPWVPQNRAPTAQEREAALLASSVLLAAQRIATDRRNDGKDTQEDGVKSYLRSLGFSEVPTQDITTLVAGPKTGEFCGECKLGDRKADIVVRLPDTRFMPIECKVSNSSTNSVKRLNNDSAVKARAWTQNFGTKQVVPAAVISGVFNILNLTQAQDDGLAIYWAHDLGKLGEFIARTDGKTT